MTGGGDPSESPSYAKKHLKIYVAGTISPKQFETGNDAAWVMYKNVMRAIEAGIEVIKKGHVPFVPHLDYWLFLNAPHIIPLSFWYQYDYFWLPACDALLRLPGESTGADAEEAWAKEHGLRVYYSLDDIPDGPAW